MLIFTFSFAILGPLLSSSSRSSFELAHSEGGRTLFGSSSYSIICSLSPNFRFPKNCRAQLPAAPTAPALETAPAAPAPTPIPALPTLCSGRCSPSSQYVRTMPFPCVCLFVGTKQIEQSKYYDIKHTHNQSSSTNLYVDITSQGDVKGAKLVKNVLRRLADVNFVG